MAKRRTKKDKQKAKHTFTVNWETASTSIDFEPDVKGQIKTVNKAKPKERTNTDYSEITGLNSNLATIKKDITKSLLLAGLILASEVVIYLIWK